MTRKKSLGRAGIGLCLLVAFALAAEGIRSKKKRQGDSLAERIRAEADALQREGDALARVNGDLMREADALARRNAEMKREADALERELLRALAIRACEVSAKAALLWTRMTGREPDSLEELAAPLEKDGEPLLRLELDPWGSAYRLERLERALRVVSAGPDREFGTDDDVGCAVDR